MASSIAAEAVRSSDLQLTGVSGPTAGPSSSSEAPTSAAKAKRRSSKRNDDQRPPRKRRKEDARKGPRKPGIDGARAYQGRPGFMHSHPDPNWHLEGTGPIQGPIFRYSHEDVSIPDPTVTTGVRPASETQASLQTSTATSGDPTQSGHVAPIERTVIPVRRQSAHSNPSQRGSHGSRASLGGSEGSLSNRSPAPVPDLTYQLRIRQQPGKAAAVGLSPSALGRLPVVPTPIVELVMMGQDGQRVSHTDAPGNLPYLVCTCSLLSGEEDGDDRNVDYVSDSTSPSISSTTPRVQAGQTGTNPNPNPLAMLCGTRVCSSIEAIDLQGDPGIFFIFWDVSIRQEGTYRLKYTLVEALPGSPVLATVVSAPFRTVPTSSFPGEVEMVTPLTRHFHQQGLHVYVPPLGMATSTSRTSLSSTSSS